MNIFLILLLVFVSVKCQDYCSYCSDHIGCDNDDEMEDTCQSTDNVVDLVSMKDFILTNMNNKRNQVASGRLSGFSQAAKMGTTSWDDELAYLAELSVKECVYHYDSCYKTDRFPYSVQSIAQVNAYSPQAAAQQAIDGWFNQYRNCRMSTINSFDPVEEHNQFTAMIHERNNRVGCGMLQRGGNQYLFTCNYAVGNLYGYKVYTTGRAGSQCITGTNAPLYPALCSYNENIDVAGYY